MKRIIAELTEQNIINSRSLNEIKEEIRKDLGIRGDMYQKVSDVR